MISPPSLDDAGAARFQAGIRTHDPAARTVRQQPLAVSTTARGPLIPPRRRYPFLCPGTIVHAVPMLGEGLPVRSTDIRPHRPDVIAGGPGHALQDPSAGSRVGAGHLGLTGTVAMHDQGAGRAGGIERPDRPQIGGGQGRAIVEGALAGWRGIRVDGPTGRTAGGVGLTAGTRRGGATGAAGAAGPVDGLPSSRRRAARSGRRRC